MEGKGGGKRILEGQFAILDKVSGLGLIEQVLFEQRCRSRGREFQAEETTSAKALRYQETHCVQAIERRLGHLEQNLRAAEGRRWGQGGKSRMCRGWSHSFP